MAALCLQSRQPVVDALGQLETLAGLPGGDDEAVGWDAAFLQRALDVPAVEVHHVGVGDDISRVGQTQVRETVAKGVDGAPPGDYRISAARMIYFRRHVCIGHVLVSILI